MNFGQTSMFVIFFLAQILQLLISGILGFLLNKHLIEFRNLVCKLESYFQGTARKGGTKSAMTMNFGRQVPQKLAIS